MKVPEPKTSPEFLLRYAQEVAQRQPEELYAFFAKPPLALIMRYSNLTYWIPLLDAMDTLLADHIARYRLNEKNPPLLEVPAQEETQIGAILSFLRLLIVHCHDRSLYSLTDRLHCLVALGSVHIQSRTLRLLATLMEAPIRRNRHSTIALPKAVEKRIMLLAGPADQNLADLLTPAPHDVEFSYFVLRVVPQKKRGKKAPPTVKDETNVLSISVSELRTLLLLEIYRKTKHVPAESLFRLQDAIAVGRAHALARTDELVELRAWALASYVLAVLGVWPFEERLPDDTPLRALAPLLETRARGCALEALASASNSRPVRLEIVRLTGANVGHGLAFRLLDDARRATEDGSVPEHLHAFLKLLEILVEEKLCRAHLVGAGLVEHMMAFLTHTSRDPQASARAVSVLRKAVVHDEDALDAFLNGGGVAALIDATRAQITRLWDGNFPLKTPFLPLLRERGFDEASLEDGRGKEAVLKYMEHGHAEALLRMVSELLHSESSDRFRNLFDLPLLELFNLILARAEFYGPTIVENTLMIITKIIHNEPTSFSILSEAQTISYVLDHFGLFFLESGLLPQTLVDIIGAVCLSKQGLAFVQEKRTVEHFFQVFYNQKVANLLVQQERLPAIAAALDELGRHCPELKPVILEQTNKLVAELPPFVARQMHGMRFYKVEGERCLFLENDDPKGDVPSETTLLEDIDEVLRVLDNGASFLCLAFTECALWTPVLEGVLADYDMSPWVDFLVFSKAPFDHLELFLHSTMYTTVKTFEERSRGVGMNLFMEKAVALASDPRIQEFLAYENAGETYFARFDDRKGPNEDADRFLQLLEELTLAINVFVNVYLLGDGHLQRIVPFVKEFSSEKGLFLVETLVKLFRRACIEEILVRENLPSVVAFATFPESLDNPVVVKLPVPKEVTKDSLDEYGVRTKNTLQIRCLLEGIIQTTKSVLETLPRALNGPKLVVLEEHRQNALLATKFNEKAAKLFKDCLLNQEFLGKCMLRKEQRIYNFMAVSMIDSMIFKRLNVPSAKHRAVFGVYLMQEGVLSLLKKLLLESFEHSTEADKAKCDFYADIPAFDKIKDDEYLLDTGFVFKTLQLVCKLSTGDIPEHLLYGGATSKKYIPFTREAHIFSYGLLYDVLHLDCVHDPQLASKIAPAVWRTLLELFSQVVPTYEMDADYSERLLPLCEASLTQEKMTCEPVTCQYKYYYGAKGLEAIRKQEGAECAAAVYALSLRVPRFSELAQSFWRDVFELGDVEDLGVGETVPFVEGLVQRAVDDAALDAALRIARTAAEVAVESVSIQPLVSLACKLLCEPHAGARLWFSSALSVLECGLAVERFPFNPHLENVSGPLEGPNVRASIGEEARNACLEMLLSFDHDLQVESGIVAARVLHMLAREHPREVGTSAMARKMLSVIEAAERENHMMYEEAMGGPHDEFDKQAFLEGDSRREKQIAEMKKGMSAMLRGCFETVEAINALQQGIYEASEYGKKGGAFGSMMPLQSYTERYGGLFFVNFDGAVQRVLEGILLRNPKGVKSEKIGIIRRQDTEKDSNEKTDTQVTDSGEEKDTPMEDVSNAATATTTTKPLPSSGVVRLLVSELMAGHGDLFSDNARQKTLLAELETKGRGRLRSEVREKEREFRNPGLRYTCFVVALLAELLSLYKQAKLEFLTFSKKKEEGVKPRSTALNFILHQLLGCKEYAPVSTAEGVRRDCLWKYASAAVDALVSATPAENEEDADLLFVRTFCMEIVLKALRDVCESRVTVASTRYAKMQSLAALCSLLLSEDNELFAKNAAHNGFPVCKAMVERQLPAQFAHALASLDFSFPHATLLARYVVEYLNSVGDMKEKFLDRFAQGEGFEEDDDELQSDQENEMTSLFRNSSLGMYDVEMQEDDWEYESDDSGVIIYSDDLSDGLEGLADIGSELEDGDDVLSDVSSAPESDLSDAEILEYSSGDESEILDAWAELFPDDEDEDPETEPQAPNFLTRHVEVPAQFRQYMDGIWMEEPQSGSDLESETGLEPMAEAGINIFQDFPELLPWVGRGRVIHNEAGYKVRSTLEVWGWMAQTCSGPGAWRAATKSACWAVVERIYPSLVEVQEKRAQERRRQRAIVEARREEQLREFEAQQRAESDAIAQLEPVMVDIGDREVNIAGTGIDLEFLLALPMEMREEVFAQHMIQHEATLRLRRESVADIDPAFLEALPDELRDEIVLQSVVHEHSPASEDGSSPSEASGAEAQQTSLHGKKKRLSAPLVDKRGVACLIRLLFLVEKLEDVLYLTDVVGHLCHNKHTCFEALLQVCHVLEAAALGARLMTRAFARIGARARDARGTFGISELRVARNALTVLNALLGHTTRLRYFFVAEQGKYPLNGFLKLVDKPIISSSPALLQMASQALKYATWPLSFVERAREAGGVLPGKLELPKVDEKLLVHLIGALIAGDVSSRTFENGLACLRHLAQLPNLKNVFSGELSRYATECAKTLVGDLERLNKGIAHAQDPSELDGEILGMFTSPGATQNRLLRVLMALDLIFEQEPELKGLYEKLALGPLWSRISDCLRGLEAKKGLHSVASVLLPLIESLMVVCKHSKVKDLQIKDMLRYESGPPDFEKEPIESLFFTFTSEHKVMLNEMIRNKPQLMSGPFAMLVRNPRILEFDNKRNYFDRKLHTEDGPEGVLTVDVRRENVFLDSYRALAFKSADEIRNKKLDIVFKGEGGVDGGGLTREWYQVLLRQIFNPGYALFVPVPSDESTFHPNRTLWVNLEHLAFFKFIGRIFGKAIYDGQFLDAHFSRAVYKLILKQPVSLKDMETLDLEYAKLLKWMLDNDITDVMAEVFCLETDDYGEHKIIDLIPGGRDIPVTEENKHMYVQKVVEYRLQVSVKDQLDKFLEGFFEMIPQELIAIFDEQELELLILGLPDIDVDDWKNNTTYTNYSPSHSVIQWFWRAVKLFDNEQKAKLLQFVTGTSKVPLEGFSALAGVDGKNKFSIHRDYGSLDRLPSAHTCFNQLDLPAYELYEQLRANLLLAVTEANEGFGFA